MIIKFVALILCVIPNFTDFSKTLINIANKMWSSCITSWVVSDYWEIGQVNSLVFDFAIHSEYWIELVCWDRLRGDFSGVTVVRTTNFANNCREQRIVCTPSMHSFADGPNLHPLLLNPLNNDVYYIFKAFWMLRSISLIERLWHLVSLLIDSKLVFT